MLKIAYHLGIQKAMREEDIVRLVKEAQDLGIDLEKDAFWGTLASGAKALGSGVSQLGKGLYHGGRMGAGAARAGGKGLAGTVGSTIGGAGRGMSAGWRGLTPNQQLGVAAAGGLGLEAMGRDEGEYPAGARNPAGARM